MVGSVLPFPAVQAESLVEYLHCWLLKNSLLWAATVSKQISKSQQAALQA